MLVPADVEMRDMLAAVIRADASRGSLVKFLEYLGLGGDIGESEPFAVLLGAICRPVSTMHYFACGCGWTGKRFRRGTGGVLRGDIAGEPGTTCPVCGVGLRCLDRQPVGDGRYLYKDSPSLTQMEGLAGYVPWGTADGETGLARRRWGDRPLVARPGGRRTYIYARANPVGIRVDFFKSAWEETTEGYLWEGDQPGQLLVDMTAAAEELAAREAIWRLPPRSPAEILRDEIMRKILLMPTGGTPPQNIIIMGTSGVPQGWAEIKPFFIRD